MGETPLPVRAQPGRLAERGSGGRPPPALAAVRGQDAVGRGREPCDTGRRERPWFQFVNVGCRQMEKSHSLRGRRGGHAVQTSDPTRPPCGTDKAPTGRDWERRLDQSLQRSIARGWTSLSRDVVSVRRRSATSTETPSVGHQLRLSRAIGGTCSMGTDGLDPRHGGRPTTARTTVKRHRSRGFPRRGGAKRCGSGGTVPIMRPPRRGPRRAPRRTERLGPDPKRLGGIRRVRRVERARQCVQDARDGVDDPDCRRDVLLAVLR